MTSVAVAARNIRMMHLLERIALRFNQEGVPLMVLKGAALFLTLYRDPARRMMTDLDLMVQPRDVDRADAILESLGCRQGEPLVREDFFPEFYYEREYFAGHLAPVKIDLHVRPFRPLRYARMMDDDALWRRAKPVSIGEATIMVPGVEDMLIHLAAHCAIHGGTTAKWVRDIREWIRGHDRTIDWDEFIETTRRWRLELPVGRGLQAVSESDDSLAVHQVVEALLAGGISWRDRLCLWQTQRDAAGPAAHIVVNALCTPGLRFTLRYLRCVLLPGREHMSEWYGKEHFGWTYCAHLVRWASPLLRRIPGLSNRFRRCEVRPSSIHGSGLFATRNFSSTEIIARFRLRPLRNSNACYVWRKGPHGQPRRYEISGRLRFLNHACRPNAQFKDSRLIALREIQADEEITVDYGPATCNCPQPTSIEPPVRRTVRVKVA